MFLEKKLSDIITVHDIYKFTYDDIIRNAKTVDAIWFNERKMPCAFYEVEHTTNIKNSLNKFFELQDFRAKFYIVADKARKRQFEDVIGASIYNPIREMVGFVSYDDLVKQYSNESKIKRVI